MKKILAAASAAALAVMPTGAQAATIELALVIDGSGSISAANFALQRQAYFNVLGDPSVLPLDGSVAIGVWQFATGVSQVFAMSEITAANINTLRNAINTMAQLGGNTNIAGSITTASNAIFGNASPQTASSSTFQPTARITSAI